MFRSTLSLETNTVLSQKYSRHKIAILSITNIMHLMKWGIIKHDSCLRKEKAYCVHMEHKFVKFENANWNNTTKF